MKKRLYKSQNDRALFGVCGGIAEYFEVDSLIVRLLFVLFTIMYGVGIMFYLIAALIMPNEFAAQSGSGNIEYVDADGKVYQNRASASEKASETQGSETISTENKGNINKPGNHANSPSKTLGFLLIALGVFMLLRVFLPQIDVRIMMAAGFIAAGVLFVIKKS
ncbi:MAG: PspC domain-containing protein [Clostridia bacterium]|nr:PspC domain-containing protein [Clostridia bacterium]